MRRLRRDFRATRGQASDGQASDGRAHVGQPHVRPPHAGKTPAGAVESGALTLPATRRAGRPPRMRPAISSPDPAARVAPAMQGDASNSPRPPWRLVGGRRRRRSLRRWRRDYRRPAGGSCRTCPRRKDPIRTGRAGRAAPARKPARQASAARAPVARVAAAGAPGNVLEPAMPPAATGQRPPASPSSATTPAGMSVDRRASDGAGPCREDTSRTRRAGRPARGHPATGSPARVAAALAA